mgnify:CR=1 FL=1
MTAPYRLVFVCVSIRPRGILGIQNGIDFFEIIWSIDMIVELHMIQSVAFDWEYYDRIKDALIQLNF